MRKEIQERFKKQNDKIIMMHCVSSYPLNAENVNFNKMRELTKIYNKIAIADITVELMMQKLQYVWVQHM